MRLMQANVSLILREQFGNVSARGLMDCLTRLGDDIELNARPAKKAVGQLLLRACDPATFCEK